MTDKPKYERGSALSIFKNDRTEDLVALVVAFVLALAVIIFIPN